MLDFVDFSDASILTDPKRMLVYAIGIAVLLTAFGAAGLIGMRDRQALRLRRLTTALNGTDAGLRKADDLAPSGWKKALIPDDPSERAQIRFQLAQVGFDRTNSVEIFFLVRLLLAIAMPVVVIASVLLANAGLLSAEASAQLLSAKKTSLFQISAIGTGIGFYGPSIWLNRRIKARQSQIRMAFPNALDLLQISMEAGLGFDAAISRVGKELGRVAPEVAYELILLQIEVQAGRDREAALFDMAERMGIEEARSFALVIVQSLQFGTSLTLSLKTYAAEMRQMRELAAQEKANKLPVQMSAVMSVLMLPALFMITLTPIIIRYMAMY